MKISFGWTSNGLHAIIFQKITTAVRDSGPIYREYVYIIEKFGVKLCHTPWIMWPQPKKVKKTVLLHCLEQLITVGLN
jgi:hypothetical protein